MNIKTFLIISTLIASYLFYNFGRGYWFPVYLKFKGARTVDSVIKAYGDNARKQLQNSFQKANTIYPPKKVAFLVIKETKTLELWSQQNQQWHFIKTYPVQAASGELGPKLKEGDRQVPEGIYKLIGLNPNSSYHLSMKLNYPNSFDQKWAKIEGRTEPGTNIFIHGKAASIGCLAMGDEAIEELFVLTHDVKKENIEVIISPTDPRKLAWQPSINEKPWITELYKNIEQRFLAITQ